MSDMGDDFKELRAARAAKRARNRERGAEALRRAGVRFETKNAGAHLIVEHAGRGLIDYWPGTGLWRARYQDRVQTEGRGVQNLLNHLRRKHA